MRDELGLVSVGIGDEFDIRPQPGGPSPVEGFDTLPVRITEMAGLRLVARCGDSLAFAGTVQEFKEIATAKIYARALYQAPAAMRCFAAQPGKCLGRVEVLIDAVPSRPLTALMAQIDSSADIELALRKITDAYASKVGGGTILVAEARALLANLEGIRRR